MTKQSLKNFVKTQFKTNSIEAWLVRLVCSDTGCSPSSRLNDIVQHGCISGCISELIYYNDCLKFYARFEEEIWARVNDFRASTGFTLGQFLDGFASSLEDAVAFKTYLAWFAVEHTAHHLLAQCLEVKSDRPSIPILFWEEEVKYDQIFLRDRGNTFHRRESP